MKKKENVRVVGESLLLDLLLDDGGLGLDLNSVGHVSVLTI